MTTYLICMETDEDEVYRVLQWLDEEWEYVKGKFGGVASSLWDEHDEPDFIDEWARQILQYFDRAKTFGLDDPRGRQALAKAAATAIACAGSTVRVYGQLPVGGTPSGTATPRS